MGLFSRKSSSGPNGKKKKRVLILYDFPLKGGGSGAFIKDLSLRLQERDIELAVALPDKNRIHPSIKQFSITLPQIPVFIGRPGLEKSKKYSDLTGAEISQLYTSYLNQVTKIVEDYKPNLIHAHHLLISSWVANFIRGVYGVRFVLTSHGSDLYAISSDRRYFRKSRESVRTAERITVVSPDTREKLLRMFTSDFAHKTRTIPGGIRLDDFPAKRKEEEIDELKRKFKLKDGIVLFTGRLISEKGVEYLVKAAGRIKGQIVIAGDGPQKRHLEEMIKKLKLQNVRMIGYIDRETLIKLYYAADVFVAPSVWDEPLGLTIIEAMASGVPVVVTRRGGVTMAVKDEQTGLFVRSRNASDIAEKVNRLLSDKELARKMGQKARNVVLDKFTWKKIAHKYELIYNEF